MPATDFPNGVRAPILGSDGTVADPIADLPADPTNAQIATAFNTLLAALRDAGIIQT